MTSVGENIAGSDFSTSFTYDSYGRLSTKTHPSGIIETLGYTNGYMSSFSAGGSTRYTVTGMNARQQLTTATYGGGTTLNATYGFDTYGYPSSVAAGTVQDYRYSFNAVTGNLNSRQNYLRSKSESFTYDNLDRLLTVAGPQNLTMTFAANGNISTKSDIGTTAFGYGASAGPYALTGVTSSTGVIPAAGQTATYTSFEKVNTLAEDVYSAAFVYNSGNQRAKMTVTQSGSTILTRWYGGNSYMKETASGLTKEYTYIGGDAYSAPVAAVTQSGTTTYYYLLRDHLGNITHQVSTSNSVVAEFSFDAWGRRRNPTDWGYNLSGQPELFADRGFTGHEHLKWFNLVNMNGRLYDPLVGRFLSVDPYIQDPGFTQEYNRYSYCLNNPLRYTDPSGYKKAPVKEDAFIMDYANYWNRRILHGGGGGGFGGPGQGRNGAGLNGVYYDWGSNKYKSTAQGNEEVGWSNANYDVSQYGTSVPSDTKLSSIGFGPRGVYIWQVAFTGFNNNDLQPVDAMWRFIPGKSAAGGGGGFNWDIPIGGAGTVISAGTEYANNMVRTSFKTGRNPISWSKLTPRQQAWRTANVLGKNAKYVKYVKGAGVVGAGISVAMAGRDLYMGDGTMIDYFDVGIGTASIGAAIFLATNPVGWFIGAGAAVYFGGRLVYDICEEVTY